MRKTTKNHYIIPFIATTTTLIIIEFVRVQQGVNDLQTWLWYIFSALIILAISIAIGYTNKTIESVKAKKRKKNHGDGTKDIPWEDAP